MTHTAQAQNDSIFGVRASFGVGISDLGFRLACLLLLLCSLHSFAATPRILVFQRNGRGYVHNNLAASAAAIQEIGKQHGFDVDVSTNAAVFTDAALKQYAALVFANSNNEAFENEAQRAALQRFIRRGGGFMGIHSSTGSERQWNWFQQMQGAKFLRHPPLQQFTIDVLDPKHPSTAHLGSTWDWMDECYFFTNLNRNVHVLLAVDTNSLRDPKLATEPGQKSAGVFPLAWCQQFESGRQFYTSLGHKSEHYSQPVFRQHLLGGIHQPGIPADRARSTYVHPLYGLDGEVLTDDFPKDHYHHRGLFWAWPHVRIGEQHYDLWMLKGIEQRFVRWSAREAGTTNATLGIENGWFVGGRKMVREQVWFHVLPSGKDERILDVELFWVPLGEPLTLEGAEGKSYGGLTLRFAPRADTVITTPLGQGDKDLSITRLPWADLSARFAGRAQASGAAIFVGPNHPDFPPEWLTRHYGVLCLGWPGVKPKTFQPGETIRCQYRIWIHRGVATVERVQRAYRAYELDSRQGTRANIEAIRAASRHSQRDFDAPADLP